MSKEEFDEFVDKLQKEIIEQEIKDFNEKIVNLFHNPLNWGQLTGEYFSGSYVHHGQCGFIMKFFLKIQNGIIEKANFITDGCGASVAAGSQATILIEGKPISYIEVLKPEMIDKELNGLPQDHKHCAEVAVKALNQVLYEYKKKS